MIWYLTRLIFIDFIFWPPEVIDIWRSWPPGPSEVIKGSQNGIGTPKNLWFNTSHDPFSLILYFDLRRSLIFGGHDLQDRLRSKRGLRIESEHQKTYDLIPHMTHLYWFHILTSGGHWYLEVTTSRTIWGNKGVPEWNRNTKTCDFISQMTYFHWFHILTSGGHWYLEVTTARTIWGNKGVSE